jgi:hypothetical protein
MALGFAPPFQSRLGPIAQRAAMAAPQPLAPPPSPFAQPQIASRFPALPQPTAPPAQAPTAPAAEAPGASMPETPAAAEMPAEADAMNVEDLIAAIFGG